MENKICKKNNALLILEIDARTEQKKYFYNCSLVSLMENIKTGKINAREETKKLLEEKFSLCKECKYYNGKKIEAHQLSFPFKQKTRYKIEFI